LGRATPIAAEAAIVRAGHGVFWKKTHAVTAKAAIGKAAPGGLAVLTTAVPAVGAIQVAIADFLRRANHVAAETAIDGTAEGIFDTGAKAVAAEPAVLRAEQECGLRWAADAISANAVFGAAIEILEVTDLVPANRTIDATHGDFERLAQAVAADAAGAIELAVELAVLRADLEFPDLAQPITAARGAVQRTHRALAGRAKTVTAHHRSAILRAGGELISVAAPIAAQRRAAVVRTVVDALTLAATAITATGSTVRSTRRERLPAGTTPIATEAVGRTRLGCLGGATNCVATLDDGDRIGLIATKGVVDGGSTAGERAQSDDKHGEGHERPAQSDEREPLSGSNQQRREH
jgi:hypothetical protein